ncbi:MAG: hypothetical protein NC251_12305 [Lachnoclostridium sp.]|nr:hypothetical protein [Lachnospira sp.]MCM1249196.1 hypothetical protein [Lachnoclostridium sp.]
MNKNKDIVLFDPIINSEDEMIINAGIQNNAFLSPIYLRAYIMATLCFTKQLVVTDTAISLNRAFRTLIYNGEEEGNYISKKNEDKDLLLYPTDFSWLIKEGHIRVAARDDFTSFSDLFESELKEKNHVDKPGKEYLNWIDQICPSGYIKKYSKNDAFLNFSSTCRRELNKKLNDNNISPERERLLQNFLYRLSDKEMFTYSIAKSILLDDIKLDKKHPEYNFIRREILRPSYDYNIPNLLNIDYCMSFRDIEPSRKQDWMLDLSCKKLEYGFSCNVFGLAVLPARNLKDLWDSKEFENFEKSLTALREKSIESEEYIESLTQYIQKINDVVKENYNEKIFNKNRYDNEKLTKLIKIEVRRYSKTDGRCAVALNIVKGIKNIANFKSQIGNIIVCKLLSNIMKEIDDLPELPEKMDSAIIIKSQIENNSDKT